MIVIASSDPKLVHRCNLALRKKYPLHVVNQKSALIHAIASLKPRVLVLDADLPRLRAVRDLPNIQSLSPSTKILLLSAFPTKREGFNALKAGARGYASQKVKEAQIAKAVALLMKNDLWFPRATLAEFVDETVAGDHRRLAAPREIAELDGLSPRRRQIAELAARGISNRDIASRLNVSPAAVKAQLTQIFRHLKVAGRLQLVLLLAGQIVGNQHF
jgi:two-component system, NarL family, response regulator DevR